jgi:hypothetical protein
VLLVASLAMYLLGGMLYLAIYSIPQLLLAFAIWLC